MVPWEFAEFKNWIQKRAENETKESSEKQLQMFEYWKFRSKCDISGRLKSV